jgi:sulfur carrier protein
MKIILNNRIETFDLPSISVNQLLQIKNFTYKMLIVKVNDETVNKDKYADTLISDGDKVAVVHLMTGG